MPLEAPLADRLWQESFQVSYQEALARNEARAAAFPVGGRLKHFSRAWSQLEFSTEWHRQLVGSGLVWEWIHEPPPHVIRGHQCRLSEEDLQALRVEVEAFIAVGAVEEVAPSFARAVLPLFTVPKKDGGRRGVINATPLNDHVSCPHFRIEGPPVIAGLLRKGDWMVSLDLTKAYLHVPLPAASSRFLCFEWEGRTFTFRAMPFGLNVAPRAFTKLMRVPVAEIRYRGLRVTIYLDDLLVMASAKGALLQHATFVVLLLTELGFVLNAKKCTPEPVTCLEHLGLMVDSVRLAFRVPTEKLASTLAKVRAVLRPEQTFSARVLARLAGSLSCLREASQPVHLYLLNLNRLVTEARKVGGWEARTSLDQATREDLQWLLENLRRFCSNSFATPRPDVVIQTDASFLAWAGIIRDNRGWYSETRGLWTGAEGSHSISPLELQAGINTLRVFGDRVRHHQVLWRSDNASVVWGVTKWKSTSLEMNRGLRVLFDLVTDLDFRIVAQHVPGASNHRPDFLSRWLDPEDWMVHPAVFAAVNLLLGPCEVDAFATSLNHLLPRWWSRFPVEGAEAVDALRQNFAVVKTWCNPPFSLLLQLLGRIRSQRATAVVVIPRWPGQPWWPVMLSMLAHPPVVLPASRSLFLPQCTRNQAPLGAAQWPAWAVRVSGHPAVRRRALEEWGPALQSPVVLPTTLLSPGWETSPSAS